MQESEDEGLSAEAAAALSSDTGGSDEEDKDEAVNETGDDTESLTTLQPERFDFSRTAAKPRFPQAVGRLASMASFLSLGISPSLQAALSSMSIRTPTEVQAACIPNLLAGVNSSCFVLH